MEIMKQLFLVFISLQVYSAFAQHNTVELPTFPSYFTKTIDTVNYYKNGGTLKGNVKEVTKYVKSYRATSKYFNQKNEPISAFGKKLQNIKIKNKNVKEIYFLDTNPRVGNSYRKRDENNYYLGQIITYDAKNRIHSLKKINDDLSEELFEYRYNNDNQVVSVIEKAFLSAEVVSKEGAVLREVLVAAAPTYVKTTRATYRNKRLVKLTKTIEDEYNPNIIHAIETFNYYSGTKVREVVLDAYQMHKETTKKVGESKQKFIRLFYNPDNTLKETILNYKNKQEGNVTVKTNYRQIPSLPFEIIRITTSAELNDKMDILTENFEIKRDKKQNIIEVKNSTNQNWSEKITFRYKYY